MTRILFILIPVLVMCSILRVGQNEDFKTITSALQSCVENDEIEIQPGTYFESLVVTTSNIIIRGADPENPPKITGHNESFSPTWEYVGTSGNIVAYKTPISLPFTQPTNTEFSVHTWGDLFLQVYEDEVWMKGYKGRKTSEGSYMYSSIAELDPSNSEASETAFCRDINSPKGRFYLSGGELYVATANNSHPKYHTYQIPLVRSIFTLKGNKIVLQNLLIMYSNYVAVDVQGDDITIENNFIINSPKSIINGNGKNLVIRNNMIKVFGFYEKNDYISVRYNMQRSWLVKVYNDESTKGAKIYDNLVSGSYGISCVSQDCEVYGNIISNSQSLGAYPQISSYSNYPPPGYNHNVRIHDNVFHHLDLSCVSSFNTKDLDRGDYGNIYFFRNLIYSTRYLNKDGCDFGICAKDQPSFYIYHNTHVFGNYLVDHGYKWPVNKRTVYRNNLFVSRFRDYESGHQSMYYYYVSKTPDFSGSGDLVNGWNYFPFSRGPDADYNMLYYNPPSEDTSEVISRFGYNGQSGTPEGLRKTFKRGNFSGFVLDTGMEKHSIEGVDPQFLGIDLNMDICATDGYDSLSGMKYQDVISQGFSVLLKATIHNLVKKFELSQNSKAVNSGVSLPSSWPDSIVVYDGKPDIGFVEHNNVPINPDLGVSRAFGRSIGIVLLCFVVFAVF